MRIITDWEKIVGEFMAGLSIPRKLVFQKDKTNNATLHVEVANSSIATEMSYMEILIIEKIATYFGYKAVSRLKISQNLKAPIVLKKQKVVSVKKVDLPENLKNIIAGIEDDNLKTALSNLWGSVSG